MRYPLLIFDFDGTLADTFDLFLDIFDQTADQYGFRRFDRENMDYLRTLDARSILHYHRVPMWKVPAILHRSRRLMERQIHDIRLFSKIDDTLARMHESGVRLALLTSNSAHNVLKVLGPEVAARFDFLECGASLFGKRSKLRRLLVHSGVAVDDVMLIGDEIRDAQAAIHAGVAFGAVGWGYSAIDALVKAGAQEHFQVPEEIVSKLTG
jgi:phosphoglycolate phosphatase